MASLSNLPNELKLHILHDTPDLATLFALARTSSSFWHLYYQDRQSLTTATAIAQLLETGIDVKENKARVLTFHIDFNRFPNVSMLLRVLQAQIRHKEPIKLSVNEFIALVSSLLDAADTMEKNLSRGKRWRRYWLGRE